MSFIEINYIGELRTRAVHLKSGETMVTDTPTDNNGKGESFSPTDLVAVSLVSCMVTVVGIKVNAMGLRLEKANATIEKIMASNPRRIHTIKTIITIRGLELDTKQKQLLVRTAMDCPVAKSLHRDLIQQVKIEFK